jgi:hypothetical protein
MSPPLPPTGTALARFVALFPDRANRKAIRQLFTFTRAASFGPAKTLPRVTVRNGAQKVTGEMLNIPECDLVTLRLFVERRVQELANSSKDLNREAAAVGRHMLVTLTQIMGASPPEEGGMHQLNTSATKELLIAGLNPLSGPNGMPRDVFPGWELVYIRVRLRQQGLRLGVPAGHPFGRACMPP